MNILGISASASENGSNFYLLKSIADYFKDKYKMEVYQGIYDFELFTPKKIVKGIPENIQQLKDKIVATDLIIIATPEYTHNIPAVLKNMIEWCTHSGEFSEKRVLPITFTPHPPRGGNAMSSLIPSLNTLNAIIVSNLSLYKTDVIIGDHQIKLSEEVKEMLTAVLEIA